MAENTNEGYVSFDIPETLKINTSGIYPDVDESPTYERNELMARASYSRLAYYKNCPQAYRFKYIDKLATLQAPEQKDRQGNVKPPAWQRGSAIHQAMDDYINSRTDKLRPELYDLRYEINEARELKISNPDRVLTEQNKYFDLDYNLIDMDALSPEEKSVTSGGDPCPLDYHVLVIIDLLIFNEDFTEAKVIDLKSGKEHAVKHMSQTQLYALFTAMEYPDIEMLTTQLWYCDKSGKITSKEYSREKILKYFNFWHRSINLMHTDTKLRAKPHESNCMFCEYGPKIFSNKWVNKTGDCSLGLDKRNRLV